MSQGPQLQPTYIVKRDGRLEKFDPRKVETHLITLSWGLDMECVKIQQIMTTLSHRLPADPITSEAFLIFFAEIIASFSSQHPDYSLLAGRVYACYHHGHISKSFSAWVLSFANASPPVFTDRLIATVREHGPLIDAAIVHRRDFDFTYVALQTFERSYLTKNGRELSERLQFLFMRVAVAIYGDDLMGVLETYELLSTRKLSFASSILWNGGLANRHYASSFIVQPPADHPDDGITSFSTISSLWAADGGVGISVADVPATRGIAGAHPGLLPLLRVYDSLAAYWSRSSTHRASSAAVHVPIWHADVRKIIVSRTNMASTLYRFRHLFPSLWVPNIFMRRLESDSAWSFFDPTDVPDLSGLYSDAFDAAYVEYERRGLATSAMRARALWDLVSSAIRESGTPFIMFGDNVNARNNQMHLGLIKSSNLCTEVVQYSSPSDTPVCVLASLCLPRYIRPDGSFNYPELHRVTKFAVKSLDRLIDLGDYPVADAAISAYRTRPVSVGVQGLADVFGILEIPFTSPVARAISRGIAETIYHGALECSCDLAEDLGAYDSWQGSPAQQGVLQLDMWNADTSNQYDFDALRDRMRANGLRNSVLTAQMPTSSTAPLFGNSEGVDPYTSNVLQFRVLCGNFNEVSRTLVNALRRRGLWSENMRTSILDAHGSVQSIDNFPDDLKDVFKTAFELDPIDLINMAVERAPFIDQSQSFTLFLAEPSSEVLMDLELHAWRSGLKTGAYYVRSKSPTDHLPLVVGQPRARATPLVGPAPSTPLSIETVTCPCDT